MNVARKFLREFVRHPLIPQIYTIMKFNENNWVMSTSKPQISLREFIKEHYSETQFTQ